MKRKEDWENLLENPLVKLGIESACVVWEQGNRILKYYYLGETWLADSYGLCGRVYRTGYSEVLKSSFLSNLATLIEQKVRALEEQADDLLTE